MRIIYIYIYIYIYICINIYIYIYKMIYYLAHEILEILPEALSLCYIYYIHF